MDLSLFDVEELSDARRHRLRAMACRTASPAHAAQAGSGRACGPIAAAAAGIDDLAHYAAFLGFEPKVRPIKRDLLDFLLPAKRRRAGVTIAGYGAPAKGNTLLNYCGIGTDFLDYVVDRSPHKQGFFLPGSGLPILAPGRIAETRPDYVLVLPWNLIDEITGQMAAIRSWGGRFVTAVPTLAVLD